MVERPPPAARPGRARASRTTSASPTASPAPSSPTGPAGRPSASGPRCSPRATVTGLRPRARRAGSGSTTADACWPTPWCWPPACSYRQLDADGRRATCSGAASTTASASTEASACADEDVVIVGGANSAGQAAVFFSAHAAKVTLRRARRLPERVDVALPDRADRGPATTSRCAPADGRRGLPGRRPPADASRCTTARAGGARSSTSATCSSSSAPRRSPTGSTARCSATGPASCCTGPELWSRAGGRTAGTSTATRACWRRASPASSWPATSARPRSSGSRPPSARARSPSRSCTGTWRVRGAPWRGHVPATLDGVESTVTERRFRRRRASRRRPGRREPRRAAHAGRAGRCSCSRRSTTTSWRGSSRHGEVETRSAGDVVYAEGDPADVLLRAPRGRVAMRRWVEGTDVEITRTDQRGVYVGRDDRLRADRRPDRATPTALRRRHRLPLLGDRRRRVRREDPRAGSRWPMHLLEGLRHGHARQPARRRRSASGCWPSGGWPPA